MTASSRGSGASSVLVLIFGSVLFHLAQTDLLLRYVRPATRPLVLAATTLMMTLAVIALLRSRRAQPRPTSRIRAGWLVLVPVLLLISGAPPALSVSSADRVRAAPRQPTRALPALPTSGVVTLGLSDIVIRTAWDQGRSLRGRRLRVVGFARDPTAGGFILTRLAITCCAADAERNDLEVRDSGPAPARGEWVEVTGRFGGMSKILPYTPVLIASDSRAIPQPVDPYE